MYLRYFFIKDCIKDCDISIEHCDTNNMLGDYFTKPLQGKTFSKRQNDAMRLDPNDKNHSNHRSVLRNDENHSNNDDVCMCNSYFYESYVPVFI
jgi:hypothetical protein